MNRLDRLKKIADLILDTKLAEVQAADRARRESLGHLDSLQVPMVIEDPASARVALRYEQWADARRAEINVTLARQTAEWLEAQDRARLAFGRAQVLRKL
ncbi:hypothetical protein [Falsirhodobacter sp. 20TX0035]|uniref:hypothetical protein n=1 Tax=Falsirhodobacter sp. 20TX0035 TaxID=3022019 RepID=UPI002330ADCF|nr:hypothetical protein [Falsirhodobacter sp. 20TX0035]MDB6452481.1 hypothetical protein [Falsirhodobacter sp. 20TX0035]